MKRSDAGEGIAELNQTIVQCESCPRLRDYCERVAREKRKAFLDWDYWEKPLPGFGDPEARLLVVGLAPAAHGGLRTGRMFCGDGSGDWLIKALYQSGFSNQPTSTSRDDGLELDGAYLTAVVRCAPPGNEPRADEVENCLPYLRREIRLLRRVRSVLTLGHIAFDGFLTVAESEYHFYPKPRPRFRHGAVYSLGQDKPRLYVSYHPSRQNTQTGRLTWTEWEGVFKAIRSDLPKRH